MKSRTLIVALALTINDDSPTPTGVMDIESLADYLVGYAEDAQVVGVLDREAPENSYEPQLFTAWPGSVKWPHADDIGVDPGFSDSRGMEHAF